MNSKVSFILGTIIGAGIGVAGTYSYFKDKYEKLAEKDFNSRRVFDEDKKDESEEPVAEKTADSRTVDKPSIAEYAARLQKEGYVNYSDMQDKKQKQEIGVDKPYVIQPSDFGEFDDYEKISLTYTADGVLLDDMNEIVDDIEETVGEDSLEHVFKCLFSKEDIKFEDMCETKSVSGSLYLDLNEALPDVSQYEKEFSKAESDFKKGLLSDTTFESTCQRLNPLIAEGHNYRFIGKVGQFCPIKDGCGGGLLMREKDGKYYAATGTKGYRWLESEMVRELDKIDDIDRSYYDKLVNEAIDTISEYGDFEWFVSDDPYITEKKQDTPKLMPCGDAKYTTCFDCPHFNDDTYHMDCGKNYDISEVISSQVMNPPVETK